MSQRMNINDYTDPKQLPQPHRPIIASAHYKRFASDFIVEEIIDNIDFTGCGEHLWMQIKKTGLNTAYLAKQLAQWANIPQRDVGYSGLKDRHAVTSQWFSLRIPKAQLPARPFAITDDEKQEYAEVLQQFWHSKKLNRSTHKRNKFTILLRNIVLNDIVLNDNLTSIGEIEKRLKQIKQQGVPNYFGEQRFGYQGKNITLALEWFQQGTINGRKPHPKKSRDLQSILLSSARSAIFNQILARRVTDDSWNQGLDGEVFNLAGTASIFVADTLDDTLRTRIETGDIYPTGALWGVASKVMPTGEALALEQQVIDDSPLLKQLAQGLEIKGLKQSRRPLCLPVLDFDWQWQEEPLETTQGSIDNLTATPPTSTYHLNNHLDSNLKLTFELPSGSFATSVLASLVNCLAS